MGAQEMEGVATPYAPTPAVVENQIVRFDRHQVLQHLFLMLSFTLLALTGLPLKFHDLAISQWMMDVWGGIDSARLVHRYAAYLMVADCVYHVSYIGFTTFILKRPFPIKIIPTPNDGKLILQEIGYFVGLRSERPQFDRFDWRQKFDYWAIFWGMPVMVLSGFILAYPVFASNILPGWIVPAAIIAHGDEAILAVSWIVIIHIFFNHFSPRVFPINTSIFTGKVSEEVYRHEHPLEYERWQQADQPEEPK